MSDSTTPDPYAPRGLNHAFKFFAKEIAPKIRALNRQSAEKSKDDNCTCPICTAMCYVEKVLEDDKLIVKVCGTCQASLDQGYIAIVCDSNAPEKRYRFVRSASVAEAASGQKILKVNKLVMDAFLGREKTGETVMPESDPESESGEEWKQA